MKHILLLFTFCLLAVYSQGKDRRYLLFTEAKVSLLEERIERDPLFKERWEKVYAEAETKVENERLRSKDCETLGFVYRVTGEKRFAEKLKKILLSNVSQESWERGTLLKRNPPWKSGLGTAHNSYEVALGFDCIYDYLTKAERKQIAEGIVQLGVQPTQEQWLSPSSSYHTLDTMGHNWWSSCVYMAGFSALAVRDEIPEAVGWAKEIEDTAQEWIEYSGSVLQNKPATFDRDGGFYESTSYASYAMQQYLYFLQAFENTLPDEAAYRSPILDSVGDFFINTTYFVGGGDDMATNFGDSSLRAGGGLVVSLLWNLGYKKDHYAWYLNRLIQGGDPKMDSPVMLGLFPKLPELEAGYLPEVETSHLYQDMGWATLRNSWEDDATMLAIKSGFTWNHAHADAGSYVLFHKGKNLIIDSGKSSYLTPEYTSYYCQSEAHNVVLFDGKGQDRNDPYFGVVNPASLHNLIEGKDFKYILANATGPYSQILARNYRSFIWVGDVILVIDDLLAHEPGQFEWLLHYNGDSELKGGIDLTIRDGDAGIRVRPLYPETFPPGGERPHDFPEHMRLTQKVGHPNKHPDQEKPYWSISHFEKTVRTKFVTAIILEDDAGQAELPRIEKIEGKYFHGVSITQNGETTDVYLNLYADGRLKHRNSSIVMNGWETDAYLMAIKYPEGEDGTKLENVDEVFVTHGSYLRRDGQVVVHSLSKYTALIEDLQTDPQVTFEGQEHAVVRVYSKSKRNELLLNGNRVSGEYSKSENLLKLNIGN